MKSKTLSMSAAVLLTGVGSLLCCGPYFPNMMLVDGDANLWLAPQAIFQAEVERMQLVPASFQAKPPASDSHHRRQTEEAELADLEQALRQINLPPDRRHDIATRLRTERTKIIMDGESGDSLRPKLGLSRIDPFNRPSVDPHWPAEFADYFRGSVAWHEGNIPAARAAWQALLARPEKERPYRSTWAAFMLGRSWEEEDRNHARGFFQEVRTLAQGGFADSLGLAAASLGFEARLHWRDGRHAEAIHLYLDQAAAGDPSALNSLRFCAGNALDMGLATLKPLARHPRAQALITAYVIAGGAGRGLVDTDGALKETLLQAAGKVATVPASWHAMARPVDLWLQAVESAGITNVDSAEKLALAAYQAGDMASARRWIERAPAQPAAQWLQAKLHLRDGRAQEAAVILARLARQFPAPPTPPVSPPPAGLFTNLFMSDFDAWPDWTPAAEQLRAEVAVLQLARRQYVEALDALVRSGYWLDAAYVAERVLTLDELHSYVDQHWPAPLPSGTPSSQPPPLPWPSFPAAGQDQAREKLRYLLARRLARNQRGLEARAYYPAPWRTTFDEFTRRLEKAGDTTLPDLQRARHLFQAAKTLREYGLELIGTEVEPDWHAHKGQFTHGIDIATRLGQRAGHSTGASGEEIDRALAHGVVPNERFHYRYLAASLAWEAARIMPDNNVETARMLNLAGGWLKNRDPEAADKFYKALVNRCRQTDVGTEADRLRWFPVLDANGNLKRNLQP